MSIQYRCSIFLFTASYLIYNVSCEYSNNNKDIRMPDLEKIHHPGRYKEAPARMNQGVRMPAATYTPDWRLEEPPWMAHRATKGYIEVNRPYRMSPHFKQMTTWKNHNYHGTDHGNIDHPDLLGCYCTTVYKRLTVLAGCAVLTPRHILTTATSTEIVLSKRRKDFSLENVLGLWYDTSLNTFNSSMYATPARIHYHPKYIRADQVNATHPLPFSYDLSVWATTYPMSFYVKTCQRANSGWGYEYGSTTPRPTDLVIIVGFQFVKYLKKNPLPWFKYAVRTRDWVVPCPKNNWGWFHCLSSKVWAQYGMDSGAAWHRVGRHATWLLDGLAGMGAFSLKLRSEEIVHYFTVINTHSVLDFMYDAYMGRLNYEYLDGRFQNSQWRAPRPKNGVYVPWRYIYGEQSRFYTDKNLPFN